jgi:hypothetical protein
MAACMDRKLSRYYECKWEPIEEPVLQSVVWREIILLNGLLHLKKISLSICAHWLQNRIVLNAGATLFTHLASDIIFGEVPPYLGIQFQASLD